MQSKEKISAFQFFTMLFISRTLTTVTYLSSYTKDIRLSDMLIQPIFRIAIGIIIMIPVFLFYKKHNSDPLTVARSHSTVLSKIISLCFVFAFFWFAVVTIARLDVFAGTVVFPETDINFLLIFTVALCTYGAYLGFEALSRSAVLSAFLVLPALAFILIALIKKVDLLNLTPIFYNGVTPVIKTAVDSVGQTIEYAVIAVALPKIKGNAQKGFFIWLILQTLLMVVMFFFAITVMGNFASTQLFPFHTLASLAEFAMFDRLDAIFTSVWLLCAFIKVGLLIYLQADILHSEFQKLKRKHLLLIIGIATTFANLLVASEFKLFYFVDNSLFKIIITTITIVVIPLIVLLISRKGMGKCEDL